MSDVRHDFKPPLAEVTLDRPRALNALDLEMIRALRAALEEARSDARLRAVVVTGAGGRAFCAGGDVRDVVLDIRAAGEGTGDGALARTFFLEEYGLNHAIARFEKPWISLLDGIVMGGGAGISVHGSHRVATERTLFAMPETGIGFFPDVGASYFLPRCPGEIGTWLALTGARLGPGDLLVAGLATHLVGSAALPAIVAELAHGLATEPSTVAIDRVLAAHATPAPAVLLNAMRRDVIDRCFAGDSVGDILVALEREKGVGAAFADETIATLRSMSPTSLVATLVLLRAGRHRTLEDALAAEYRASQAFARMPDFMEGVRAVLIDKDKSPKWRPAKLEEVDQAAVRAAIEQPADRELTFPSAS